MKNIILILAAVLFMTIGVSAVAMDWSSFGEASFNGITASPDFTSGILTYTLSISGTPTITIGANTYDILWVQGFYALSKNGTSKFYAGGNNIDVSDKTAWKWDTNPNVDSPNNYIVAGWSAQGENNRIFPGHGQSFSFTNFDVPVDTTIILGLHVGYYDNGELKNVTAFFKEGDTPHAPELPTPLLAGLGGTMLLMVGSIRRRFCKAH